MRILILALVMACTLPAQVYVSCAPHDTSLSKSLFVAKVAKHVRAWECELRNQGVDEAVVSEAQLVGWLIRRGRIPLGSDGILVGAAEFKRRSFWKTAARISQDALFLTTVLAAGDVISVTPRVGVLLGFANFALPRVGERLESRPPSDANYERVAFAEDAHIAPHSSKLVFVFTEARESPEPMSDWLDLMEPYPAGKGLDFRIIPGIEDAQSYDMRDLWASAACRTIVSESEKVTSYPVDGPELWAQARQQGLLLTTLRN